MIQIDPKAGKSMKIPVRMPSKCDLQMTGPAIVTAPDGAVWCTLLGGEGSLLRIDPVSKAQTRYALLSNEWMHSSKFIHMQFFTSDKTYVWASKRRGKHPLQDAGAAAGADEEMLHSAGDHADDVRRPRRRR